METLQNIVIKKTGCFSGVAIETSDKYITYPEFDRETDRFAKRITDLGIGPGMAVILHMKRSIEMVIAMFGIIKSGAAFVPIIWDFPVKRVDEIKKSSNASLVVTDEVYSELMRDMPHEVSDFVPGMAAENDPAVILYTSGSTGVPKGVMQSQGAAGFIFEQYPYRLEESGIRNIEFDDVIARLNHGYIVAYHFEYPIAILNGKRLLLLDEEEQNSISDTCLFLNKSKSCSLAILPSQLGMFLEDDDFIKALNNVSCLCFFAEPLPDVLRNRLLALTGFKGAIISVYGQTEVFGISWSDLRTGTGMHFAPGVSVVAIDENGELLDKDVKGELVVKARTVFTKYLLGDDRSSKQEYDKKIIFVEGERYLRTGDIGIITTDNEIKLHGRCDRMVKYHGQRVELSEIEKLLNDCEGIRSSCAMIVKGSTGEDLLVAYYEGELGECADITNVKRYMARRLPSFMIPLYFIRLEEFPHNINGKVDYITLRNMSLTIEDLKDKRSNDDRALNDRELIIARLSARILKTDLKAMSASSSLMAMGMDSLKAVLLINELSKEGYFITVEDFIISSDIHELSGKLKTKRKNKCVKKDVSKLVRCTDMQSSFCRELLQIVHAIVCKRYIDENEVSEKIRQMAISHPVFRSSFIEDEGNLYTKVLKTRPIRYNYTDIRVLGDGSDKLSKLQRETIGNERVNLFMHPDPTDLIYVKVFLTHEDKTVIIMRFDHRAVDGMTEKILFREFASRDSITDVDNYIEYLDYTGDDTIIREAVSFWREHLKGTEVVCIPKNTLSRDTHRYKRYSCNLTGSDYKRLKELCRDRGISIPAYVICQYGRALMDVLGKDDIVVPVAVSGRSLPIQDTDRIAGCLVNEVPVRIKRNYSEKDFMESYLKADRYSFLQKDIIFSEGFEMSEVPKIAPFIVSEIFPDDTEEVSYEMYEKESFELFNRGEFLWEDALGVHLIMHPDVDLWDEGYMDRIFMRTTELLKNNL